MTKLQYLVGYLKNYTPNRWFGWLRQPKKSLNRPVAPRPEAGWSVPGPQKPLTTNKTPATVCCSAQLGAPGRSALPHLGP
jgi:hypothetical protein